MNRFAGGLIAGGIIGAVGITVAMGNKKNSKKIAKSGRKIVDTAENVVSDMKNKIW